MARRGTKVGDAYISIHGDNSDWVKSARRVRDKWLGEEKQAGKKFEKVWADSIDRTIDRQFSRLVTSAAHRDFSDWVKQWGSMDEAARRFDATLDDIYDSSRKNNAATKEQAQTLRRHWEEWSKRERERLEYLDLVDQAYKENALFDRERLESARRYRQGQREQAALAARMERRRERERTAEAVHVQRMGRLQEQALKLNARRDHLLEQITKKYREVYEVQKDLTEEDRNYVDRVLRRHMSGVETINQHWSEVTRSRQRALKMEKTYATVVERYLREHGRKRSRLTHQEISQIKEVTRNAVDGIETIDDYFNRTVRRNRERHPGGLLGRLAGSRNDFLNLVGRLFLPIERGAARLGRSVDRLLQRALDPLLQRLSSGGQGAQRFGRMLEGLGSRFGGLLSVLIEAGAVLAALNLILGPAVALVSSLAGGITALASSIMAGIVGTLATALPILGAAGAGIAALVVGVTGMTDAQKRALGPLKSWYKELSRTVANNLFGNLSSQINAFVDGLGEHFETSLSRSASAISEAIDGILETVQGRDFQRVLDVLDERLPNIVGNVIDMFGSLGVAVSGIMSAISPQVERLTDDWAKRLSEWADWAISPEGQSAISDWFDDMLDSAQELWDLLGSVGDVLGALMGSDELTDTGDSWISNWADSLRELADWIKSPQGAKAIDKWMKDAKRTFSELGDIVHEVSDLFDTLNTPENQQKMQDFLDLLGDGIDLFEDLQGAMEGIKNTKLPGLGTSFNDVFGFLTNIDDWVADLKNLPNKLSTAWASIGKWFKTKALEFWESGQNIAEWLIKGLAKGLYDTLVPDSIKPYFDNIILWVKQVFGIASPSTVMYDIGVDVIQGLINGIESMLGALGTAAQSVVDTLERIWNGGEGGFPGVVGRAVNEFADLVPGLSGVLDRAASAGAKGMSTIRSKVVAEAKPMPGKVRDAIANLSVYTAREGSSAASRGANAFSPYATRITAIASRAVSALRSTAGAMYSAGYAVGYNAGRGMVAGMKSQSSAVYATAASMAKRAISAAKSTLISRSPSRAMMRLGEYAVEGFLIPFQDSLGAVGDASEQMVQALLSPLSATSMFAQGKAATEGLLRGLGNARHQVNVDGMMVGDSARARTGHTTIIQEGAIRLESKAQYTQTSTEQFLDGLADRLVGV